MIERYSRPEMARLWSQDAKYDAWLKVELAVCEVYAGSFGPQTQMPIVSAAKWLSAATMLALVDEGKLRLE